MSLFNSRKGVAFINPFQLQNLANNQVGFLLVNLTPEMDWSESLMPYKSICTSCSLDGLQNHLEEKMIDGAHPVVLIADKERVSNKGFHKLDSTAFANLYVVEGGWPAVERFLEGEEISF